ncbi:MAG: HaeII family restriction endonuclease [Cyanobacteriota bacterium]
MNSMKAKKALDTVINKARVHFYKPIQIAEILHRDRVYGDIDLSDLSSYKNLSKKWRDIICNQFLGRTSTSSARYQDDLFNENAVPPNLLNELGEENRNKNGIVEAYIYRKFESKLSQMTMGLGYCSEHSKENFDVQEFLSLFWHEPGLKRSIDKIYEIIVFSLFSSLIDSLDIFVEISIDNNKAPIIEEFKEFAHKVIYLSPMEDSLKFKAKVHRVGVTNAADRGIDMWTSFGLTIQVKHVSLTEDKAQDIVSSVSSDRIVIVCKDTEEKIILSILNQVGWKSKIQSIITETELIGWYEKALRGKYANIIGDQLLQTINDEIKLEFPITDDSEFTSFLEERGYTNLSDSLWEA